MSGGLGFIVFLSSVIALVQCEWCTTDRNSWTGAYEYEYCDTGCCGSSPDEYCCPTYVGIIIGAVLGTIFLVCLIIACICFCMKKKGHTGVVISPQQTTAVSTVTYTTAPGTQPYVPPAFGTQPYGPGYQQPPPYGPAVPQAPQYSAPGQSGQDPAYPPLTSGETTGKTF